jgi:hypothetical protein
VQPYQQEGMVDAPMSIKCQAARLPAKQAPEDTALKNDEKPEEIIYRPWAARFALMGDEYTKMFKEPDYGIRSWNGHGFKTESARSPGPLLGSRPQCVSIRRTVSHGRPRTASSLIHETTFTPGKTHQESGTFLYHMLPSDPLTHNQERKPASKCAGKRRNILSSLGKARPLSVSRRA